MTTVIIVLALIGSAIWGLARMFRNYNSAKIESEKTDRLEDRLQFRRDRWKFWRSGGIFRRRRDE